MTVEAVLDARLRKVQMELQPVEYDVAIQAHRLYQPVCCEGELVREGRNYVLRNSRGFRMEAELTQRPSEFSALENRVTALLCSESRRV